MTTFITRRLLISVLVLFCVSVGVFAMVHLAPGDPVELMFGSGEVGDRNAVRERLGLNDSLVTQYVRYIGNALQGDFGRTIRSNRSVTEEFFSRFQNTLILAVSSLTLAIVFGGLAGIASAVRPNSWIDYTAMGLAVFGISVPVFWLGLMLIFVFSYRLEWLPVAGFSSWRHLILPAITLSTLSMATIARMTRSSLLNVLNEDYVRTAYSKGLSGQRVLLAHALKNGLIPIVTVLGLQFGQLLGGAVVTEVVFAIPGVGRLVVDAINSRDFPLVQGSVMFLAIGFILINLAVDVLYAYIDPRIRY